MLISSSLYISFCSIVSKFSVDENILNFLFLERPSTTAIISLLFESQNILSSGYDNSVANALLTLVDVIVFPKLSLDLILSKDL